MQKTDETTGAKRCHPAVPSLPRLCRLCRLCSAEPQMSHWMAHCNFRRAPLPIRPSHVPFIWHQTVLSLDLFFSPPLELVKVGLANREAGLRNIRNGFLLQAPLVSVLTYMVLPLSAVRKINAKE